MSSFRVHITQILVRGTHFAYRDAAAGPLVTLPPHRLSRDAVLQTLLDYPRIGIDELLLQEPRRGRLGKGDAQAAALAANLLLEVVVQEGVRVLKRLVAAVAGKGRSVIPRNGIESNVRGEEDASRGWQSGVGGHGYAGAAVGTDFSVVVLVVGLRFFCSQRARLALLKILAKLVCEGAEDDFESWWRQDWRENGCFEACILVAQCVQAGTSYALCRCDNVIDGYCRCRGECTVV